MPWCSGKVTVPSGCSTALVMNRRPGHAPQLPPPAVDALAEMATAPAGMAIAISAVRPSVILTNVRLRNLAIFMGCPFLRRGRQPGRRPTAAPLFCSPLLASEAARILGPPASTTRTRRAARTKALQNTHEGHPRRTPKIWSAADSAGGRYHRRAKLGRTRGADQDPQDGSTSEKVTLARGDRAGMTAAGEAGREHAYRSVRRAAHRGQQPLK